MANYYGDLILVDGKVGFGMAAPIYGRVCIEQSSSTGALPVLWLKQDDVDVEFISFRGAAAVGDLTRSIVDQGDQAFTDLEGWIKIYVRDDGNQITDKAYYLPLYSLS